VKLDPVEDVGHQLLEKYPGCNTGFPAQSSAYAFRQRFDQRIIPDYLWHSDKRVAKGGFRTLRPPGTRLGSP
jgi:hypothetical protein